MNDNQECIKLVSNLILQGKTKHIEMQFHFIKKEVQIGEIKVLYIQTEEQLANLLIKPINKM